jgi:tRNA/rRNA methyltransferase
VSAAPPIRLVLLHPRNAENVGAVARAMKNFGLADWALVAPAVDDLAPARRLAVHAGDLLDGARRCATLAEAVSDCAWVVGTTPRRVPGRRHLTPGELAREALGRAPARTAIVFGDERSGLSNADALRCHDLSAIPADAAQPSLNLAQAALLYCWSVREAALAGAPRRPAPRAAPATDAELARVEVRLREVLRGGGFLAGPERHGVRDLADTLRRARLSGREARLWLAALSRVARRLAR